MVSPTDLIYAQRLRALRLSKGFEQKEAAGILGFNSQQQYSKLETGHSEFSDDLIKLVCEKFNVSFKQFVNGTGDYFNESPHSNNQNHNNTNNNNVNDVTLINEVLQTKNKLIEKLEKENEELKQEIERLKNSTKN